MSAIYSIGAVNQFSDALERAGFSPEDLTKLTQFGNLKAVRDVIYGRAEINYLEHLIDCDANPFVPSGWTVEEHKKGGQFKFSLENIPPLYLSNKQEKGSIEGNKLRKEVAELPVLNVNVLDYLLAHPELIPEDWKNKYVFFWGTIYRDSDGSLCVRCLDWHGSAWRWGVNWLGNGFYSVNPAILASSL